VGTKVKPQANRKASMKVRIIDHVNHVRYKDIDVKNMKQAQEMMEDNSIYDDYKDWEYGKEYGETYIEKITKKERRV